MFNYTQLTWIKNGAQVTPFERFPFDDPPSHISVTKNGQYMWVDDKRGSYKKWNFAKGRIVQTYRGFNNTTTGLHCYAVSPDDRFCFTALKNVLRKWDLRTGKAVWSLAYSHPISA
jgi:WD40 repeat protein